MPDFSNLPQFISADADQIIAQCNAFYEGIVGKPLLPAQTEAIVIKVLAYREKMMRDDFNEGGRKMLLDFSSGPLLDMLVALVGVERLSAAYAKCTLQFSLVTDHTGVTVPALTRVQSNDGKSVFQTDFDVFIPAGTYTIDIPATAMQSGLTGNGYSMGLVNSLLDPLTFVVSVINSTPTGGGSNAESDESLVQRAKLAPDAFSNCGSYGAYKYFALSAHPTIIDAKVCGPDEGDDVEILPGQVYIFPLVSITDEFGNTPPSVLDAVFASCSPKTKRPLCDEVVVVSPDAVPWDVIANVILYTDADHDATVDDIGQRLNDYAQNRKSQMSQDVTIDQLKGIVNRDTDSVFKSIITINGVAADLTILSHQYAMIGTITINVTGYSNG